jgi:hypothetical protein
MYRLNNIIACPAEKGITWMRQKKNSKKITAATKKLTLQTKFDLGKSLQFLLTANSNHV